jgi:8-oxo-dGTP pyrophosphatase MutT (NUDIX family)/phosphohistidine phosphatase SixA
VSPFALRPAIDAAGAVVWRVERGRLQVLLIHRPRYDDWSWPKGKLEEGETAPDCAVREVAEETGYNVVLGARLPGLSYRMSNGNEKVVDYWAAQVATKRAVAVTARPTYPRASKSEVDETRWLDVEEAHVQLTRVQDRVPLHHLADLYETDRLRTWAVVIARHGQATKRNGWKGSEASRPLTKAGAAQAAELVPVLAAFGINSIISSPWARCEQTIRPYSKKTRIPVALDPVLTENSHKKRPQPVFELIAEALDGGRNVVICTHRPVLPTVTRAISEVTPIRLAGSLPQANPYLRPSEALVVHMAKQPAHAPRAVSIERWHPRPRPEADEPDTGLLPRVGAR